MSEIYEIFEKLPDGSLLFIERVANLERAKMRFFALTFSSGREYLVWNSTRGSEVALRTVAHA